MFNFTNPANFDKTYSFTATGRAFDANDQIHVVVPETPSANAVLTYADGKFTGKTTHANYDANKSGYAIYPAAAYNNGEMTYSLPADGTQPTSTEIWAAPFSLQTLLAPFTSVKASLAQLSFTVPAGVEVTLNGSTVTAKGPKGTLVQQMHKDMMTVRISGH